MYLACTTVTAAALRGPCSEELVELRWLDRYRVEDLMPDLHHSVRSYLHLRYILQGRRDPR